MTQVTKRRTMKDFAQFMKLVVDEMYTDDAEKICVVCDNLNTHKEKAFYETFSKNEAERPKQNRIPSHTKTCNLAQCRRN